MAMLREGLLAQLQEEFTGRDPGFAVRVRFPGDLSTWDERLLARAPELEHVDARQRTAALAGFIGASSRQATEPASFSVDENVASVVLDGIADALLAEDIGLGLAAPGEMSEAAFEAMVADRFEHQVSNGVELLVGRQSGRPLVIISALGVPLRVWSRLLADGCGWQVIVPKLATGPLFEGGMHSAASAAEHAEAIAGGLRGLSLEQPPWLLGWCNGGRVALEAARQMVTGGVILLCPTFRESPVDESASPGSPYEDKLEKLFALVRGNAKVAGSVAMMIGKMAAPTAWGAMDAPAYFASLPGAPRYGQGEDLSVPMVSASALINFVARTAADECLSRSTDLGDLKVAVYLIQGDADPVVSNVHARHWLERRLPNVQTYHISGAGHVPQDLQYSYLSWLLRFVRADDDLQHTVVPRRIIFHGQGHSHESATRLGVGRSA